ncbi:MAG: hypothetical protein ABIT76_15655 [Chthoniobacterales bacterium]
MRIATQEIHIPAEDFGINPFLTQEGMRDMVAREEAARDLVKHPRQLLADIHAESLNPRTDFVARTLARMASMQLRVQEQIAEQTKATEKLNKTLLIISSIALIFAALSLVLSGFSFFYDHMSESPKERSQIKQKS